MVLAGAGATRSCLSGSSGHTRRHLAAERTRFLSERLVRPIVASATQPDQSCELDDALAGSPAGAASRRLMRGHLNSRCSARYTARAELSAFPIPGRWETAAVDPFMLAAFPKGLAADVSVAMRKSPLVARSRSPFLAG